jgi:translation initiation factor IF-3
MTKEKVEININWEIAQRGKVKQVRIVGTGQDIDGVYDVEYAIKLAKENEVDLVEINKNSNPPICKLIEYQKYLYELKKRKKENEKKSKQNEIEIKELRFSPNTDTHDFEFKKRHAEDFIKDGNKVKCVVIFHGREMHYKDKGQILLLKLADDLSEIAIVESLPKMEGYKMIMYLKPKK